MWWFDIPKVVFGEDALSEVESICGCRAFIVTDRTVYRLGIPDRIVETLSRRRWSIAVWDQVQSDPTESLVREAADAMRRFGPDWIIAVGGGSVMDTAKAAWILYEHPQMDIQAVSPLQPLDLRNRARLICVPTTTGTGSEVTKAIVIREDETGRKMGTSNRELVPDIAILDPSLTRSLPPTLTANTGMDALCHAVEAYVSQWKNPFSDACAVQAVRMVFEWLPRSVDSPDDLAARENMLVAACLAGMAFSNSQVALAHSLGHSMGPVLGLHHGLAVGLALPYTVEYNHRQDESVARQYAGLAAAVGIHGGDPHDVSLRFATRTRQLMSDVGVPTNIRAAGIPEDTFASKIQSLVEFCMADSSLTMNPRSPSEADIRRFFEYMWEGRSIDF